MHKVIIEVRMNENAMRTSNPHVPWTPQEIATDAKACVDAGAAIVHFHLRSPEGETIGDYAAYRDAMALVRESCSGLIHPTLGVGAIRTTAKRRLETIRKLVEDGLKPDLVPIAFAPRYDGVPALDRPDSDDVSVMNPAETVRECVSLLHDSGIAAYWDVWNMDAMRRAANFLLDGGFRLPPVIMMSMLNEQVIIQRKLTFGHPATAAGLRAFTDLIPADKPTCWLALHARGNLLPLIPQIVASGGHISVGLGDYPHPELGQPTNADVVREVVRLIRANGGDVASPQDARRMVGLH